MKDETEARLIMRQVYDELAHGDGLLVADARTAQRRIEVQPGLSRLADASETARALDELCRSTPSDETSGLDDEISAATVVRTDDLLHVLGVEPGRERGRTNEVAEHDRELAALGVGPWGGRRDLRRSRAVVHWYRA